MVLGNWVAACERLKLDPSLSSRAKVTPNQSFLGDKGDGLQGQRARGTEGSWKGDIRKQTQTMTRPG